MSSLGSVSWNMCAVDSVALRDVGIPPAVVVQGQGVHRPILHPPWDVQLGRRLGPQDWKSVTHYLNMAPLKIVFLKREISAFTKGKTKKIRYDIAIKALPPPPRA